jgi:DNA-binding LacI/PurR family transcriptional regulator
MLDVALRAGVSKSTVSLVLKDHPAISTKTRNKVLKAQRDLGYTINEVARQFMRNRHSPSSRRSLKSLAFVMANRRFDDPIYSSFLDGIVRESQTRHIMVHTAILEWLDGQQVDLLPILRDKLVDGIILSGLVTEKLCQSLRALGHPMVVLGTYALPPTIDQVEFEIGVLVHAATRRLISNGHRRIAFLSRDPAVYHNRRSLAAYEETMRESKLPHVPELIVHTEPGAAANSELLRSLFTRCDRPTGLVAGDIRLADESVAVMQHLGLRLPEDIEVVSFVGSPEQGQSRRFPTILTGSEALGCLAVSRLKERVENPDMLASTTTVRNVEWIEPGVPTAGIAPS